MAYPEYFIEPMRAELTRHGVEEARSPEDVDRMLSADSGTVMMVVNSVCGCAAGKARPGIVDSLQHEVKPDRVGTVFAGGDTEATARLREILSDYPPSSPSVAIFRDGKPVYMMPRGDIEANGPGEISQRLRQAFDEHCATVETE